MSNIGTAKVTTFGIEDLAIKLPSGTADVWTDVPGVTEAAYKGSTAEVEVWGDDVYQDTWFHSQKGQITAKCSIHAMRVLEMLTGNDAVSSGSYEKLQIMEDSQVDPPTVALKAKIKAHTGAGTHDYVTAVWYKCRTRVAFESVPQGQFGKAGEVMLTFTALRSTVDENNTNNANTLPSGKAAFGRIELPNN